MRPIGARSLKGAGLGFGELRRHGVGSRWRFSETIVLDRILRGSPAPGPHHLRNFAKNNPAGSPFSDDFRYTTLLYHFRGKVGKRLKWKTVANPRFTYENATCGYMGKQMKTGVKELKGRCSTIELPTHKCLE